MKRAWSRVNELDPMFRVVRSDSEVTRAQVPPPPPPRGQDAWRVWANTYHPNMQRRQLTHHGGMEPVLANTTFERTAEAFSQWRSFDFTTMHRT